MVDLTPAPSLPSSVKRGAFPSAQLSTSLRAGSGKGSLGLGKKNRPCGRTYKSTLVVCRRHLNRCSCFLSSAVVVSLKVLSASLKVMRGPLVVMYVSQEVGCGPVRIGNVFSMIVPGANAPHNRRVQARSGATSAATCCWPICSCCSAKLFLFSDECSLIVGAA